MARPKAPKKKKSPPKTAKPKRGGPGGPQMGIGDFMQDQFEERAGKKPKSGR